MTHLGIRTLSAVRTWAVAQLSSIHFYPLGSLVTRDLINLADVVTLWQFELSTYIYVCGCQIVFGWLLIKYVYQLIGPMFVCLCQSNTYRLSMTIVK